MSIFEQTLIADVLSVAHLTKLPKKVSPENLTWIEGVAKLKKDDGSIGYGIVKRTPNIGYTILYSNGNLSAVRCLEEVYPYTIVNKDFIKKFKPSEGESERISYLKSLNLPYITDTFFEGKNIDELNKEVVKAAVYLQITSKN